MHTLERTLPWQIIEGLYSTLFTLKIPFLIHICIVMASMSLLVAGFVQFAEDWWWEPFWTIPVLVIVYITDLYTGVRLSGAMQKKAWVFETRKFSIWIANLIGVFLILGMLHGIPVVAKEMMMFEKAKPANVSMVYHSLIGMSWTVYLSIFFTQAMSAIGNAAKAGIIERRLARWISKRIDTYKPSIFDEIGKA